MTSKEAVRPSRDLRAEIHQNAPFRSKSHEAFLALLRTADMAKHRFGPLFEPSGVTFQQYNVLRILRGAGPDGLPTLEIGDRMIDRTPGITRILDRLESKDWVCRERGRGDRRKVICCITPAGLDLLASLDEPVAQVDEAAFKAMAEADMDRLMSLLSQLRDRLG